MLSETTNSIQTSTSFIAPGITNADTTATLVCYGFVNLVQQQLIGCVSSIERLAIKEFLITKYLEKHVLINMDKIYSAFT